MSNEINNQLEEMGEFFNKRAVGYDEHMKGVVESFDSFYSTISKPIDKTDSEIRILDLGCGTGLEVKYILEKAPNSIITGIDMSENMLELLSEKYKGHTNQIYTVRGSYLTSPFEEGNYDYIVSVMTMHHLLYNDKLELYKKIRKALKPCGKYIEGDYIECPELEKRSLAEYLKIVNENNLCQDTQYHYDIPCSLETEEKLFREAGFKDFKVIWHEKSAAIYVVE